LLLVDEMPGCDRSVAALRPLLHAGGPYVVSLPGFELSLSILLATRRCFESWKKTILVSRGSFQSFLGGGHPLQSVVSIYG